MDDVDPSSPRGFYDQTVLNPLGLAAILILGTAMLVLPRRYAVWPMIIMGCFVAPAQRIAVFTLNFDLLRVMVLFGTARILLRQEMKGFRWHAMDLVLLAYAASGTLVYSVQHGTLDAVKYKLGWMYDVIGMYFLFRCLVRTFADVAHVAIGFATVSVPVAGAFLVEHFTGRNIFGVFGGVPAVTMIRDGRLRCQGAFAHPILAGCYWASVLPIISALWWRSAAAKLRAVIGIFCSLLIILLCASSTPVSAVAAGVVAAMFFGLRWNMRAVRWIAVALLLLLHLVMQAPVWHLIARIDLAGGSTGYYRYTLIDATIRHFSDWWAVGIVSTETWGKEYGHYLNDITNQYVLEAIRGGIWTLMLFALLISLAFRRVGRLWRAAVHKRRDVILAWAMGVSLFVHCVVFLGVSYFGQITMVWYLTLAMIASVSTRPRRRRRAQPVRHRQGLERWQVVRSRAWVGNHILRIWLAAATTGLLLGARGATAAQAQANQPAAVNQSASVTQYGITWTFDTPVTVGRFVTGDFWVVGPVTVTSITPSPAPGRNGSVVNPRAGDPQGYDDRIHAFDPALAAHLPLRLKPGDSLVTTASVDRPGVKTPDTVPGQYAQGALRTAAVLTCVAEVPPPDAFRPPYCGTLPTPFRAAQLHRERLPDLTPPYIGGMPNRRQLDRLLERVWLDHKAGWTSRYMHPLENMPDYGRDITNVVSDAGLQLTLHDPTNEKLLLRFVQLGIDNYGVALSNPQIWEADGGHGSGRKLPILFAGVLLDQPALLHVKADFAEDQQTYFGTGYRGQKALWRILASGERDHEDLPPDKWHGGRFNGDNDGWKSEAYRLLNGPTWVGECLTARLIGAKAAWNHDAFFDYVDRWMAEAASGTVDEKTLKPSRYTPATPFTAAMWKAYRANADNTKAPATRPARDK